MKNSNWMSPQHGRARGRRSMAAPTSWPVKLLGCYLTIFVALATTNNQASGALFSNAQYNSPICDSSKLIRCQQDVIRDMQTVGLNSASVQYPLSGPPYSPGASAGSSGKQLLVSPTSCRLVRSNLDCLLMTTPACYDQGIQTAQNTDIILRAKRFLEQSGCNEPDLTWQSTFCYRQPEVRNCEERYGFTSGFTSNSNNNLLTSNNITSCLAYQAFKFCIDSHLRLNCKVHEMDMANEYLIDRASDLAWRCPHNSTTGYGSSDHLIGRYGANPYQLSNQQQLLSPVGSSAGYASGYAGYEQRPLMPSYVGGQPGNLNLFSGSGSIRDQPWERFRNPVDEYSRTGLSRYPGSGGGGSSGEVFDRLVAGNAFDAEASDCPIKAAPYARECEDNLAEQHKLARDSRDGLELQRRICCSLFQYRDCISRVVLDRCADSSPTAVEILMGVRRREMTLTCRAFNRDLCSGSLRSAILNSPLLLAVAILTSFMTFQQHLAKRA